MFSVACSHESSTATVTVNCGSCVDGGKQENATKNFTEVVCENCFQNNAMKWAKNEVSRAVLAHDLPCVECDSCPSRWYDDIENGMCDNCRIGLYEEEKGFCSTYEEPHDISVSIPDEIIPNLLYLGSINTACHEFALDSCRIRNILVCAAFLPAIFKDNIKYRYHRLPLCDSIDEDIIRYLPDACQFIDNCLSKNEPVLVHCQAGVSRSASICIAYLMKHRNMTYYQAFSFLVEKRSVISPNDKFAEDLDITWSEILESSAGP